MVTVIDSDKALWLVGKLEKRLTLRIRNHPVVRSVNHKHTALNGADALQVRERIDRQQTHTSDGARRGKKRRL